MSDNPNAKPLEFEGANNKPDAFENLKSEFKASNVPDHWPKVSLRNPQNDPQFPLGKALIRCTRIVGSSKVKALVPLNSVVAYSEERGNVELLLTGGHHYVIEGTFDEFNEYIMRAWRELEKPQTPAEPEPVKANETIPSNDLPNMARRSLALKERLDRMKAELDAERSMLPLAVQLRIEVEIGALRAERNNIYHALIWAGVSYSTLVDNNLGLDL